MSVKCRVDIDSSDDFHAPVSVNRIELEIKQALFMQTPIVINFQKTRLANTIFARKCVSHNVIIYAEKAQKKNKMYLVKILVCTKIFV